MISYTRHSWRCLGLSVNFSKGTWHKAHGRAAGFGLSCHSGRHLTCFLKGDHRLSNFENLIKVDYRQLTFEISFSWLMSIDFFRKVVDIYFLGSVLDALFLWCQASAASGRRPTMTCTLEAVRPASKQKWLTKDWQASIGRVDATRPETPTRLEGGVGWEKRQVGRGRARKIRMCRTLSKPVISKILGNALALYTTGNG